MVVYLSLMMKWLNPNMWGSENMDYDTIIAETYESDVDVGYKHICPKCGKEFTLNNDDIEYGGNMCPRCLEPA
jgi:hypothetical protein